MKKRCAQSAGLWSSFAAALLLAATTVALASPGREQRSLDGTWQIVFDPTDSGKSQQWQRRQNFSQAPNVRSIQVPSCWERIRQDYEGVAWYGRTFTVPATWQDRTVRLRFGAVNYIAEVWLNGLAVGFHEGGYTPFEFDVTDLLELEQTNFLSLRVISPIVTNRSLEIDGLTKDEAPHWRGAIAGGIWQSAALIATGRAHLKDVFVEPNIHKKTATVHVQIENSFETIKHIQIKTEIAYSGSTTSTPPKKPHPAVAKRERVATRSARLRVVPGSNGYRVALRIPKPKYWTPAHPHLYSASVQLRAKGRPLDALRVRFGMRELTVRNNDYYLNGRKIFIKSGFWEGLYPTTLAHPKDAAVVRNELLLAKAAGFNLLRPWRKPPPSPVLDLADEIGMMIIDCPPIECMNRWPKAVPQVEARIANEVRSLVMRDRNHASVVSWEIFNEIERKALRRLKRKTAILARKLDPTRLVVDESGGWAGGANVFLPYRYEPIKFNEIHSYKKSPVSAEIYDSYLHLGKTDDELGRLGVKKGSHYRSHVVPGRLSYISEIGYGGLPDLPEVMRRYRKEGNPLTPDYRGHQRLLSSIERSMKESGISDVFKSTSELCLASQEIQATGNKLMLEAVRLNPEIDGYCLHAFTGGDWVIGAGMLDIWRQPKKVFQTVKEVNRPRYVAIRVMPSNVYAHAAARLSISTINELDAIRSTLEVLVTNSHGQVVHERRLPLRLSEGIRKVLSEELRRGLPTDTYRVRASLRGRGGTIAKNELVFRVFGSDALRTPSEQFYLLDPEGLVRPFAERRGLRFKNYDGKPADKLPVLVSVQETTDCGALGRLKHVIENVRRGGVAVFLNPPAIEMGWIRDPDDYVSHPPKPTSNPVITSGLFPLRIKRRSAHGHWISVNHGVTPHPVFEGLPSGRLMGQTYQNVCALESIMGLRVKPIVASISWNFRANYHGPTKSWWGADVASVPYGKGRIVLSTLRLMENLGKDPVADKILFNLVRWSSTLLR